MAACGEMVLDETSLALAQPRRVFPLTPRTCAARLVLSTVLAPRPIHLTYCTCKIESGSLFSFWTEVS
jgi:hypothetical protein